MHFIALLVCDMHVVVCYRACHVVLHHQILGLITVPVQGKAVSIDLRTCLVSVLSLIVCAHGAP